MTTRAVRTKRWQPAGVRMAESCSTLPRRALLGPSPLRLQQRIVRSYFPSDVTSPSLRRTATFQQPSLSGRAGMLRVTGVRLPMAPAFFHFFSTPNLTCMKTMDVIINPHTAQGAADVVNRKRHSPTSVALSLFEIYSDQTVPGSERAALYHSDDPAHEIPVVKITWQTDDVWIVPPQSEASDYVHIINERALFVLEEAKKKGVLIPVEKIIPDDDDYVVMRGRSPYHPQHRRWDPEMYD
eukprot:TRINITY_DN8051_c0_g1_i1.p2 TRINITY_DN8051_c0_g1~~TRINITY_DN8051_c0_g1_i1.p2  ORF type:complete len:240 (-),score=23.53 TRINITY_DN8051_c0_g1_i1:320-1039(-)